MEGGRNARADTLFAIARALRVNVSTLFGEAANALAPEDVTFYRDYCDLHPDVRDEVRHYVLFRLALDEHPGTARTREEARDRFVQLLRAAREDAATRGAATYEALGAEERR